MGMLDGRLLLCIPFQVFIIKLISSKLSEETKIIIIFFTEINL